ncbi:MAG: iron-containing alcohol dehydrogenase [Oscillospiraceae bacterium]|nr:iron-containing alcohol dehydrogenase [Oscillospiraceae bacterium]
MIMDCEKYTGKCVCGRVHTLETKKVVVDYNALANFEQYMADVGLAGKRRTVVYDSNIYALTEGKHVKADQEIVLDAKGLRSEDVLIEAMMKDLDEPKVIVAFGAGTIMDFGRYPAYKLGIPFVAVPTLASSDGFTANICSVILEGQKKSIPMCAPILVVADLDIIKGAPARLVASGINDILAKYISLVDWKISRIVADEYYCPMVADLAEHALQIMRKAADEYAATGVADHEAMTMAQMESGLTMQLLNHSRAASGAEHLMAHLVEMHPPRFEGAEGIHGECVGVGTFLCAKKYHELAKKTPKAVPFVPLSDAWIDEKFGERLAPGIKKENANDGLGTFDPQNIVDHWDEIVELINTIPPTEELEALYKACGCKYLPEHIGIDPSLEDEMLPISAAIRNRLTLIRMLRVLDFE